LVFNGTIYNYRALRRELQRIGYWFFSDGDGETILKAWHAWGEDCVRRLHGMFAFAIWDRSRRVLFLAQDIFGIKPLYWSRQGAVFCFASNTQAPLAAGSVDTRIDAVALHHLFTLRAVVPAPCTLLRGLRKLAPAHRMRVAEDEQQTERPYWRLTATRPEQPLSDGACHEYSTSRECTHDAGDSSGNTGIA